MIKISFVQDSKETVWAIDECGHQLDSHEENFTPDGAGVPSGPHPTQC